MRTVALSLTLLLVACGGSAPVRKEYLLRAEAPGQTSPAAGIARVGISRLVIAPYLDQSGIVLEGANREVTAARNHSWAEPLDSSLRLLLRSELAAALGERVGLYSLDRAAWQHDVMVFVEQLHGTNAGQAVLVADFRVVSHGEADTISEHRFVGSRPLASEGYAALVDAEAALVRQLARAIAEALPKP